MDSDSRPVLRHYVYDFTNGPALDAVTGAGRNAIFLAESGNSVDAIDQFRQWLRMTSEAVAVQRVADRLNLI